MLEAVEKFLFWVGGAVCHQQAARSLMLNGQALPLCTRCTGIYLGIFIPAAVFTAFYRLFSRRLRPGRENSWLVGALAAVLLCIPMVVDGLGNMLGFFNSAAWLRLLTGSAFGFALSILYRLVMAYNETIYAINAEKTIQPPAMLIAGGCLMSVLSGLYFDRFLSSSIISIVTIAALLAAFSGMVYMIFAKLLCKRGILYGVLSLAAALAYIFAANALKAAFLQNGIFNG